MAKSRKKQSVKERTGKNTISKIITDNKGRKCLINALAFTILFFFTGCMINPRFYYNSHIEKDESSNSLVKSPIY